MAKKLNKSVMTFSEWQDTGRFMERKKFEEFYPKENLHFDCTDVIEYSGGVYIQSLKTGVFFINANESSKILELMEKVLWDSNPQLACG
jgi:hypothetical protein